MIKGILCDLDGVVYQDGKPLPGAVDAVNQLQAGGFPLAFVTNTTRSSSAMIATRLMQMGIEAKAEDVITPITVARTELESRQIERIWLLADPALKSGFAGFALDKHQPQALVVADLADDWSYSLLNMAFNYLVERPKVPVISLGLSTFYQGKNQLMLDVGPFAQLLSLAAKAPLVVCGKPGREAFLLGARQLGLPREQVAMVGDDLESDVIAAMDAGLTGIQVKTGKFRDQQLRANRQPDVILEGLWGLPAWLRGQ